MLCTELKFVIGYWFRYGRILIRLYELTSENLIGRGNEGKFCLQPYDDNWKCDFLFSIDVTELRANLTRSDSL
jgi:hypothetical protein